MAALLIAYSASPVHAAGTCTTTATTAGTITCTFAYTGASQSWTVPDGVSQATFDVFGAQGGSTSGKPGGLGGEATATIAVNPGETLQVNVGGAGGTGTTTQRGAGGFNGYGDGGSAGGSLGSTAGGGGGGASDVRSGAFSLANRIIVAGGGGGAGGGGVGGVGGVGGGLSGGAGGDNTSVYGTSGGGGGGTSSAGGSGGVGEFNNGSAGGSGDGGGGGSGSGGDGYGGGGGGGGYYGGGGGGGGHSAAGGGGGGGGSGFGPSGVVFNSGVRSGDGLVTITYTEPKETTPPTISVSHTGANANGWNNSSPVTLNVSASDTGSGLKGDPTCTDTINNTANPLTLTAGTPGNWTASVSNEGTHSISCSVSDNDGNSASTKDTVMIDKTAPSVSGCSVTPSRLKPPNHKLVTVKATAPTVTDSGGSGPNGFTLFEVKSSQPESGLAPDDVPTDFPGWSLNTADLQGQLRAERYGGARTYTLTYRGADLAGNTADCKATVTVPKGG
jgi:hypothetical protein